MLTITYSDGTKETVENGADVVRVAGIGDQFDIKDENGGVIKTVTAKGIIRWTSDNSVERTMKGS